MSNEQAQWRVNWHVHKYHGDWTGDQIDTGLIQPYEVVHVPGNLLVNAGVLLLWKAFRGDGSLTYFSNANAAIGVGDSTTAASATQTDLQASTNKLRKAMDSTYPKVGTADSLSADNQIQLKSTFGSSDANFAWNEWACFNSTTNGVGTMLNRKQESLGTKSSGSTWTLTATISIS